jgi:hypothetical protein
VIVADPIEKKPSGFLASEEERKPVGLESAHRYWLGKVPHYGIDPRTGASFGNSIVGAEMVSRGTDLFLYGGWDPVTGARPWLMHADFNEVAKEGNLTWRYVNIEFAEGVKPEDCPKAVYGHTMTRMGWESPGEKPGRPAHYFILGGHTQAQFRNESNKWGYLELARQPDQPWTARWTACGRQGVAARALHSAVWLGGDHLDENTAGGEIIAICGGVRKSSNSVHSAIFNTKWRNFDEASTTGIAGGPCHRFGHSAVRLGGSKGRWVVVIGGANVSEAVRDGLTWKGTERNDLHIYDSKVISFVNPAVVPQTCTESVRDGVALARMHRSVQVGSKAVLLIGGGHHGGAGVSLLRWSDAKQGSADWFSLEKLKSGEMPCGEEQSQKLHSSWMPPLARHAMAKIGPDKVVMYGGKVDGSEDFHGMMLLRLLP